MTGDHLDGLARDAGLGDAAIHVQCLSDARAWSTDDGRWRYPASLIKLPLAIAATAAMERGELGWQTPVAIDAANMTPNDAPSPLQPGYVSTLRELVELMLQRSDNVATNQLYDLLDRRRATVCLGALGFPETAFRRKLSGAEPLIDDPQADGRNSFPASEAAAVLRALAEDRLPGAGELRAIMATNWWDVKLSRGLGPGDAFTHKTGDTDEVSHDAGILDLAGGGRWIVVVYTDLPSSDEHDRRFGSFMRALRPFLT